MYVRSELIVSSLGNHYKRLKTLLYLVDVYIVSIVSQRINGIRTTFPWCITDYFPNGQLVFHFSKNYRQIEFLRKGKQSRTKRKRTDGRKESRPDVYLANRTANVQGMQIKAIENSLGINKNETGRDTGFIWNEMKNNCLK